MVDPSLGCYDSPLVNRRTRCLQSRSRISVRYDGESEHRKRRSSKKYYKSFKAYINYLIETINKMKDRICKGSECICKMYDKLVISIGSRKIKSFVDIGIPWPINKLISPISNRAVETVEDVAESDVLKDSRDFIHLYVSQPIRNFYVANLEKEFQYLKRNFMDYFQSFQSKRIPYIPNKFRTYNKLREMPSLEKTRMVYHWIYFMLCDYIHL
ncbi:hypothetical protein CEXT_643691 [Caerostris extrusa]|uniref:Uncharacterized protein n=1 Tax=Caerostris extrusa TaxID=172846 RepID=A0AAV4XSP8_CAEEX|nr:hypothetical protein CEXT_643691 [Caerostris extrusa]